MDLFFLGLTTGQRAVLRNGVIKSNGTGSSTAGRAEPVRWTIPSRSLSLERPPRGGY
jgi:hypothetical protein